MGRVEKLSQEARGVKKDATWHENYTGMLKRILVDNTLTIQINDILNLKYALERRGVLGRSWASYCHNKKAQGIIKALQISCLQQNKCRGKKRTIEQE